jgi:hypothetical protein
METTGKKGSAKAATVKPAGLRRPRFRKGIPDRNELLQWLISAPGVATDGTLLDDARKRFHEILNSSSSVSSVEWLFNQLIGTPRSTIVHTIEKGEFVTAAARVTARYLRPDEFEAWWLDLKTELDSDPKGLL